MSQIAKHEPSELSTVQHTHNELATTASSVIDILNRAVSSGLPPEALEKIVALTERVLDREASQKFYAAKAQFSADCPPIPRRTENTQFQVSRNGTRQNRLYASLEDIEATIAKPLASNLLSYGWGTITVQDKYIIMPCIISHAGGHSITSAAPMPFESKAGCSEQQKMFAAFTYAKRCSLIHALGLKSCDPDNDGNEDAETGQKISEADLLALEVALDDAKADVAKFKQWAKVERLSDIPASMVRAAFEAVARRKAASK